MAVHERLGAQLAQVLDEVVDERVVVVDDEHPRAHCGASVGGRGPTASIASTVSRMRHGREAIGPSRRRRRKSTTPRAAGSTPKHDQAATRRRCPRPQKVSPLWVPVLMFTAPRPGRCSIILANYVDLLPGDEPNNWYLLVGLGLITAGFITATQLPLSRAPRSAR